MILETTTIPILQIRGNSALVYDEYLYTRRCSRFKMRSQMNRARRAQYSGRMTQGTRKRLARAATLMAQASPARWVTNPATGKIHYHKLTFITLTVSCPRNISAKEGHDLLLSKFLQWMRREHDVKTYLWKAELQERGQLHYHITTPALIHYKEIRAKWNELQLDAGFLKEFAAEYGHTDPNSTDIHEVRHVRDIARYLVKELCKTMQNETATRGKLWDCSDNLAGVPYFSVVMSSYHENKLHQWKRDGIVTMLRREGDRFTIIDFNDTSPPNLLEPHERVSMSKYLDEIINGIQEETELQIELFTPMPVEPITAIVKPTIVQQKLF